MFNLLEFKYLAVVVNSADELLPLCFVVSWQSIELDPLYRSSFVFYYTRLTRLRR